MSVRFERDTWAPLEHVWRGRRYLGFVSEHADSITGELAWLASRADGVTWHYAGSADTRAAAAAILSEV